MSTAKNTTIRLLTAVAALIVLLFVLPYTAAWYGNLKTADMHGIEGTVKYGARYFESGDGSVATRIVSGYDANGDPVFINGFTAAEHKSPDTVAAYEIKTPDQFYNLAWLQYMGYFNVPVEENGESVIPPTYFYLSADLDMTGYILPPVGTTTNPFIGNFDGCGHSVSNLTVTNSARGSDSPVNNTPRQLDEALTTNDLVGAEIVGLFGVVGNYDGAIDVTYDSTATCIKNLTVSGLSIHAQRDRALAGIVAGYVNGPLENVVVTGTNSIVNSNAATGADTTRTEKLSDYTLVGYAEETYLATVDEYEQSVTITNETGNWMSSQLYGDNWGNSIDMNGLYNRLLHVYDTDSTRITYLTRTALYKTLDGTTSTLSGGDQTTNSALPAWQYVPGMTGGGRYVLTKNNTNSNRKNFMQTIGTTGMVEPRANNTLRYLDSVNLTTLTYTEVSYSGDDVVIITDNAATPNYLTIDTSGNTPRLANTTDPALATKWYRQGNTLSVKIGTDNGVRKVAPIDSPTFAYVNGLTRYYLHLATTTTNGTTIGTLELSTASTAWTVAADAIYSGNFYVNYDGSAWVATAPTYISDGAHYLSVVGGALTDTDSAAASKWLYNSNGNLYTTENGTTYYLRDNAGALTVSTTAGTTTAWTVNSNTGKIYDGSGLYVDYVDGAWGLIPENYTVFSSGGNYMKITTTGVGNATTATYAADSAAHWTLTNDHDDYYYLSAEIGGTTYYLSASAGAFSATTQRNSAVLWRVSGASGSISVYYTDGGDSKTYSIAYSGGAWSLQEAETETGYVIHNGTNYLSANGTSIVNRTNTDSDNLSANTTLWQQNASNQYYVTVDDTDYYLCYNSGLALATSSNYIFAKYTSGNSTYLRVRGSGNSYYWVRWYNNNWTYRSNRTSNTSCVVTIEQKTRVTGLSTVTRGAVANNPVVTVAAATEEVSHTSGTLTWISDATSVSEPIYDQYPGYFPLMIANQNESGNNTYDFTPADVNSGYVVSGNIYGDHKGGDLRISKFPMENLRVSLNQTSSWYSSVSFTANSNLQVVGCSGGNYYLIDDDYNDPSTASTTLTSKFGTSTADECGFEKYTSSRVGFQTMLLKDTSYVYGLHFMNAEISKNNLIVADSVSLYGETMSNYQLPADSVDFRLKRNGFINFFAGTIYNNSSTDRNTAFFSLHEIFRDPSNETIVTDIKEISEIYLNTNHAAGQPTYVYRYTDGTYSAGTPGAAPIFNMNWVTHPGSNLIDYVMYYYEIPVNKGEYALGSISGETGAYLLYLDIAIGDESATRSVITQETSTTRSTYTYPAGVTFASTLTAGTGENNDLSAAAIGLAMGQGTTTVTASSGNSDITCTSSQTQTTGYLLDGITVNSSTDRIRANDDEPVTTYKSTLTDYNLTTNVTMWVAEKTSADGTFTPTADYPDADSRTINAISWTDVSVNEYQSSTFAFNFTSSSEKTVTTTGSFEAETQISTAATTVNSTGAAEAVTATVTTAPTAAATRSEFTLNGSATVMSGGNSVDINALAVDQTFTLNAPMRMLQAPRRASVSRSTAARPTMLAPQVSGFTPSVSYVPLIEKEEIPIEITVLSSYVEPDPVFASWDLFSGVVTAEDSAFAAWLADPANEEVAVSRIRTESDYPGLLAARIALIENADLRAVAAARLSELCEIAAAAAYAEDEALVADLMDPANEEYYLDVIDEEGILLEELVEDIAAVNDNALRAQAWTRYYELLAIAEGKVQLPAGTAEHFHHESLVPGAARVVGIETAGESARVALQLYENGAALAGRNAASGYVWGDELPDGVIALRIPADAVGTLRLEYSGDRAPVFVLADGSEYVPELDAYGVMTVDAETLRAAAYCVLDAEGSLIGAGTEHAETEAAAVGTSIAAGQEPGAASGSFAAETQALTGPDGTDETPENAEVPENDETPEGADAPETPELPETTEPAPASYVLLLVAPEAEDAPDEGEQPAPTVVQRVTLDFEAAEAGEILWPADPVLELTCTKAAGETLTVCLTEDTYEIVTDCADAAVSGSASYVLTDPAAPTEEKPDEEKPDGEDPNGEDPNGEDPNGEDPNGEDPNGEDPNGENPNGEHPNGEDPNGEDPNGADPNGEDPNGEDPNGEEPNGETPPETPAAEPPEEEPQPEDPPAEEPAPEENGEPDGSDT